MENLLAGIGNYLFLVFGILALGGACALVFSRSTVHCVIGFLFTMLSILSGARCLSIVLLVAGIFCLIASLLFSLRELLISDHALVLELEDIENI